MKPTLLILAAGMGSRYGGLKQIDPVGPNGEIIIEYSMHDAIRAGFGKIVFVIRHYFEDAFKEHIGSKLDGLVEVDYAYQELDSCLDGFDLPADREKPWGTGHAILVARDKIREPFAVINADDYYGPNSYQIMSDYLASLEPEAEDEYCMVGFTLRNTLTEHGDVCRGICDVDATGAMRAVVERVGIEKIGAGGRYKDDNGVEHLLTGDEIASMNLWGFQPSIFDHLGTQFARFLEERGQELKSEFFIPTVVDRLVDTGQARVQVLNTSDSWFGVTYRPDRDIAEACIRRLIDAGDYPERLWQP